MGKFKTKRLGNRISKPGPLTEQIAREEFVLPSKKKKQRTQQANRKDDDDEFVEGSLGQSIMKQSMAQLQEIVKEDDEEWPSIGASVRRKEKETCSGDFQLAQRGLQKSYIKRKKDESDEEEDVEQAEKVVPTNVSQIIDAFAEELEVDAGDYDILEHFKKEQSAQLRLADFFKDKITDIHTEMQTKVDEESNFGVNIKPEVKEMCKEMGPILARYRSGPLPKMFKAFPTMSCWEELVYLTNPDKWSAAAMYQASRFFISSLKAPMAQRFVCLVLLPRIRDDIAYYKRLNYHLYQGLIKILFKPAAFFKGIVFPLCEAGDCTLREAIIIGSVIAKNHIPIEHSCAAIKTISAMEYCGPSSIFLRILFDKKYALPYLVIDEVYDHFMRFQSDKRELPVLWHQSILAFVQRYKNDLSHDQVLDFLRLLKIHHHPKITAEIERELSNSTYRKSDEPMNVD